MLAPEALDFSRVPPELGSHVGWLCLAVVVATLAWAATRMESVRRSLLALEDPRMFATLRIGTALMTIQCFWNLHPYWRMLWSDEGLYDLDETRSRFGSSALMGWTPEDGFLDHWGVFKFLWGKHSLFYFWSAPDGVEWVMYAIFGVLLLYAAGVFSRLTGVLSWLLVCSVYNHNGLYLEGTDTVYRTLWWVLIFARTGDAWSFDNWVRCKLLRRAGKLQEVGEPAQPGKQPVYRLIPSWPRYLIMAQLAAIYTATGIVKTGNVWMQGDALYYALNMDHFYRFEDWTQQVSAVFGTNLFRLMTWVTRWWEEHFAIAILGAILGFQLRHRDQPWFIAQDRPWRRWLGRLALLLGYAALYRVSVLAYPYVVELPKNQPEQARALVATGVGHVHLVLGVIVPLLIVAWFALGRWPLRVRGWTIDQSFVQRWLLGRRLWLGLGLLFHGFLILFMNIGMFPFIMLMVYVAWLRGEEIAAALHWLWRQARRTGLRRVLPAGGERLFGPAQRPEDLPARGRTIPDAIVVVLGALLLAIIYKRIGGDRDVGGLVYAWLGLVAAVALVFRLFTRPLRHVFKGMSGVPADAAPGGTPGLAGGALFRAVVLGLITWHFSAVALALFPSSNVFSQWRSAARGVFGSYLTVTGTSQSWNMFAPNPPRANTFMKTVVVLPDGTRWDIGYNSYSYRPFPWIYNDRMRKMHRRMIGKGKSYLRPWSFFVCRNWFIEYGEPAAKVETWRITTKIPTPEQVRDKGWYRPADLKATYELLETHSCLKQGQLPAFMKQRYGVPLDEADQRELEAAAEKQARQADQRRRSWATRRDWGGNPQPRAASVTSPRPAAAPEPAAEPARGAEDEGGGDGE
ncbi:hypothetical protein [Nannocystis bainbridge]|uniref:HTTM domain-containing protein n=1 Tax=Nannocystis bainbridge TaxID=2995303 RepID=A0ABT5DYB5_9BACT|nr:hypothetical protein [Nannocystis bainbridge]MDC0718566.1 hypothetical protein [Nannocystis bainbridge]